MDHLSWTWGLVTKSWGIHNSVGFRKSITLKLHAVTDVHAINYVKEIDHHELVGSLD